MTKEDITVYATQSCMYCHALVDWLNENNIPHTLKFIDADEAAYNEVKTRSGGDIYGVPVTFIKNIKIEGFAREQIAAVLAQNGITI
ncbi:MAG: glutaredoxin family protein [Candidatus Saccharibacteria bacterium]|nr:glutaredoxin family protein [Candidatus Saccharibacteria bacterium]